MSGGAGLVEVVAAAVEDLELGRDEDDMSEAASQSGVVGQDEVVDPDGDFGAEVDDAEVPVREAVEGRLCGAILAVGFQVEGFFEQCREVLDGVGGLARDDVGVGDQVALHEVDHGEDVALSGSDQAEANTVEDLGGDGAALGQELGDKAVVRLPGRGELMEVKAQGEHAVDHFHDATIEAYEEVFFAMREMEGQFAGFEVVDHQHHFESEASHGGVGILGGGIEKEILDLIGLGHLRGEFEIENVPDVANGVGVDVGESSDILGTCGVILADFEELIDGREAAIVESGPVYNGVAHKNRLHLPDVRFLNSTSAKQVLERRGECDDCIIHDGL